MARDLRDPCLACGKAERADSPQGATCAFCGVARLCPPHDAWPAEVKRWLVGELLRGLMEPHGGESDHAWRVVLASVMRNRDVIVPVVGKYRTAMAASADDVWPLAVRLAAEQEAVRVAARDAKKGTTTRGK